MRKAKGTAKNLSGTNPANYAEDKPIEQKAVLTEAKLDDILHVSKGKRRVKSVLSPSAQNVIQCEATTGRGWDWQTLKDRFTQISTYDKKVAAIFDLQFAGGCRISEVLEISFADIDDLGKVTIRSQKGGTVRVIQSSFSAQLLAEFKRKKQMPFAGINRFYVYRVYKRFGISQFYGENKRASVTHLPRHEVALASQLAEREIEVTKSQLGQKSSKSTTHYTGKERGKKGK